MFLLTKLHLLKTDTKNSYIISVIIGTFYGFSGLFISNAQHIMIIISAAWLPYILFFVKKYLISGIKIYVIAASLCMGLNILGGYPEIWVATFIILIPYFLINTKFVERQKFFNILKTAFTYIMFVLGAFAASSISVIPFILNFQKN